MEVVRNYQRLLPRSICIDLVDKLYVHRAPNVMQMSDIFEWIDRCCLNTWYIEVNGFDVEYGFVCPVDNLIYCKKWGTVL